MGLWHAVAALATVFLVKVVVLLQLRDHPLLQADAGLDTTVYLDLARRVLDGNVALGPGLYFVSPLYIYFTAAVLAIAQSLTIVRVVQVAFGTAAVALVFITARVWFGRPAAWAAATLASLTGLFTFYEILVLQAALDPFLTAAFLCALTFALTRRSGRWFILTGVVLGIGALNRPNVLIAGAGIAVLMMLQRRLSHAALFTAGVLLALVPVTARNVAVAGEWSPVSSHGGLNFYIGNNPQADGTYSGVPGITPNIAGQQEDARRVAEHAEGRPLSDGEVSAHFYRRGISWLPLRTRRAARLFLRKLLYTFSASHLSLNYSFPFFAYDTSSLLRLLIVGPWFIIPVGLVGIAAAAPRRPEVGLLDLGVLHSSVRAFSRHLLCLGALPVAPPGPALHRCRRRGGTRVRDGETFGMAARARMARSRRRARDHRELAGRSGRWPRGSTRADG